MPAKRQAILKTTRSRSQHKLFAVFHTKVNIWSYAIAYNVIQVMARACILVEGDAVSWSGFITAIYGQVSIIRPAECKAPGNQLH